MTYLVAYLATAAVFLAVDYLWLGIVAHRFYMNQLGDLVRQPINVPMAAAFYAVYAVGIVIFAVAPALAADAWRSALWRGALFGFFAYATYDLTNLATLKNWPVTLSVVDILWGTFLTGAAALAGFVVTRRLFGLG